MVLLGAGTWLDLASSVAWCGPQCFLDATLHQRIWPRVPRVSACWEQLIHLFLCVWFQVSQLSTVPTESHLLRTIWVGQMLDVGRSLYVCSSQYQSCDGLGKYGLAWEMISCWILKTSRKCLGYYTMLVGADSLRWETTWPPPSVFPFSEQPQGSIDCLLGCAQGNMEISRPDWFPAWTVYML